MTYTGPSFEGAWSVTDEQMGSMQVAFSDGEGSLTDVRGRVFEFDASPSGDAEEGTVELSLHVGERGMQVLFNETPDALEVYGSMNYAMNKAELRMRRRRADRPEVLHCEFFRESRPEDTLRTVNLLRP